MHQRKQVISSLKKLRADFKHIDFLICNVGSGKVNRGKSGTYLEWKRMLDVNLLSSILIIENFLKLFREVLKSFVFLQYQEIIYLNRQ